MPESALQYKRDPLTNYGLLSGDLAHYRDGKLESYRFAHPKSAVVEQLLPGSDGSILAATTYGVIGRQSGQPVTLTEANGLPCPRVNGIIFDDSGNLWLSLACGFARVGATELQKWRANPAARISVDLLDEL